MGQRILSYTIQRLSLFVVTTVYQQVLHKSFFFCLQAVGEIEDEDTLKAVFNHAEQSVELSAGSRPMQQKSKTKTQQKICYLARHSKLLGTTTFFFSFFTCRCYKILGSAKNVDDLETVSFCEPLNYNQLFSNSGRGNAPPSLPISLPLWAKGFQKPVTFSGNEQTGLKPPSLLVLHHWKADQYSKVRLFLWCTILLCCDVNILTVVV